MAVKTLRKDQRGMTVAGHALLLALIGSAMIAGNSFGCLIGEIGRLAG